MSLQHHHKQLVQSSYWQSSRMTKSWINRREIWRAKASEIRHEFDENKDSTDRYEISHLIKQTSDMLAKYSHPDPIIPPQRPGGTSFERNIPTSPVSYKYRDGDNTI